MVAERSRALALVSLEWTVPSLNPGMGILKCLRVGDGELSNPISIHPRATSRVASSVRTVTSNMVPTQKKFRKRAEKKKKKKRKDFNLFKVIGIST